MYLKQQDQFEATSSSSSSTEEEVEKLVEKVEKVEETQEFTSTFQYVKHKIQLVYQALYLPNMKSLFLQSFIIAGMSKAFSATALTLFIGEENIGFTLSLYGATLIFGNYFFGRWFDLVPSKKKIVYTGFICYIIAMLLTLIVKLSNVEKNSTGFYVYLVFFAIIFGLNISCTETTIAAYFLQLYPDKETQTNVFSLKCMLEAAGFFILMLFQQLFDFITLLVFFLVIIILVFYMYQSINEDEMIEKFHQNKKTHLTIN